MSSLRQALKSVPLDPAIYCTSNVFNHSRLVRKSMPMAIDLIQKKIKEPHSMFSHMHPEFYLNDMDILRAASWLHDIGKLLTTKYRFKGSEISLCYLNRRNIWNYFTLGGHLTADEMTSKNWKPAGLHWFINFEKHRWVSTNHQHYESIKDALDKISTGKTGKIWKKIVYSISRIERLDLEYVIRNHECLDQQNVEFTQGVKYDIIDCNGFFKGDRKVKLLMTFLIMNFMGRFTEDVNPELAKYAIDCIERAANKLQLLSGRRDGPPNEPIAFVRFMRRHCKPRHTIRNCLVRKFNMPYKEAKKLV